MSRYTKLALGRGAVVGLGVAAVLAVEVVLSNVVFPSVGDDEGVLVVASYLAIFGALAFTGVLTARVSTRVRDFVAAGALAGALIGALTIGTFLLVDNLFLDIVSQQQSKIDGLAQSGMTSMRDYLNSTMTGALIVMTLVLATLGAGFAALAGSLVRQPGKRPMVG